MTNSQMRMINRIKEQIKNQVEGDNEKYNKNSIVTFEQLPENEYFVTLRIKFQYNAEKENVFIDQSMQLFIFKRGRIEGYKTRFGNDCEINQFWQIYF